MGEPTIEEVREAKAELIRRLIGHSAFAGAGIGQYDGRLVVNVNWRALPPEIDRPRRVGNVNVTHHEVGTISRAISAAAVMKISPADRSPAFRQLRLASALRIRREFSGKKRESPSRAWPSSTPTSQIGFSRTSPAVH